MGEFPEKKQTVYIRGLRDLDRGERSSAVNQGEGSLWLCREAELAHQMGHPHPLLHIRGKMLFRERRTMTYVNTALDVELDTAFKAVAGMRRIVEIFIITAEAEPRLGVASPRGLFKVAKGEARVVRDVIRVRAGSGKCSPKIDRLRCKDGDWGGVLGGRDLNDKGDCDLGETQELGVLDGGGADRRGLTCGVLLSAIDEHEDVAGPVDFQSRVMVGLLDGGEGGGERLYGWEGCGEGGSPVLPGWGGRLWGGVRSVGSCVHLWRSVTDGWWKGCSLEGWRCLVLRLVRCLMGIQMLRGKW